MNNKGAWVNKTKTVRGEWFYYWPSDAFRIELNSKDRITGSHRVIVSHLDSPEWGNWKLIRDYDKHRTRKFPCWLKEKK